MRAAEEAFPGFPATAPDLMERAGAAVAYEAMRVYPYARRFAVVCGGGSNGGDGRIAARVLREAGREAVETDAVEGCDVVIDALFGTGFHGAPRADAAAMIERINACGLPVVSVDLPSGVDASTPDGHVDRDDRRPTALMRSISAAASGRGVPWKPVPKSASTTTSHPRRHRSRPPRAPPRAGRGPRSSRRHRSSRPRRRPRTGARTGYTRIASSATAAPARSINSVTVPGKPGYASSAARISAAVQSGSPRAGHRSALEAHDAGCARHRVRVGQ